MPPTGKKTEAPSPPAETVRLGVCFVGGGLLGAVRSLSMMAALEDGAQQRFGHKLPVAVYVGSRSGSLSATLLASGASAKRIVERVRDPESFGIDLGSRVKIQAGHLVSLVQRLIGTLWRRGRSLIRDPFAALSEDEIQMILESLPSGFLATPEYESALNRIFWQQRLPRHFSECKTALRILAWDLDRGELISLGSPGKTGVSVTRSIAAASTLAGIFAPTPILGAAAVEVPPGCVPHLEVAKEAGADALLVILPSTPSRLQTEERDRVADRGLAAVWNQNQREIICQGTRSAVERHRLSHPDIPIIVIEGPAPRPKQIMNTVASTQARLRAITEGYSTGRAAIQPGGPLYKLLSRKPSPSRRRRSARKA